MNDARARILATYLSACERRDTDAIASCFAENPRILDPSGEQVGLDQVRAYFDAIYSDLDDLAFETGPVSWCRESCAVSWIGRARRQDGAAVTYQGIDVFTFDEENSIAQLWAFWTPEDLVR